MSMPRTSHRRAGLPGGAVTWGRILGVSLLAVVLGAESLAATIAPRAAARLRRACTCATSPSALPAAFPLVPRAASGPVAPAAKVYVADELDGTISVLDAATFERVGSIMITVRKPVIIPFSPLNIAVAPDGRTVWVTAPQPRSGCEESGDAGCGEIPLPPELAIDEVIVVDPLKDSIIARIKVPSLDFGMVHVSGVAIDRDSRFAYVTAAAANQVIRIDMQTYEIVGRVDLGVDREATDIEVCGTDLVVTNAFGGQSLSIVSTETGAVEEVKLGGVPLHVVCSADGQAAYASLFDTREVVRYDLATGALTRYALPEGAQGPVQLYLTPDNQRLYVTDQGTFYGRMPSDKLYEIDLVKGEVSGELAVGRGPGGIVMAADGKHAYVTNFLTASISVVDLAKRKVLTTDVKVGTGPRGIGYWSGPSLVQ